MVVESTLFSDLGLKRTPDSLLAKNGITVPTPIQEGAIPALLQGRDVVGQARTGSGKTLAFALPIVDLCDWRRSAVQALILVPTRELAIQVASVVASIAPNANLRWTLLYGGRSTQAELRALKAGPHIVIGTPGRTLDHLNQGNLSLSQVRMFILDEADEMLDRGFAPDVERIISYAPKTRQTALFSATLPDWVVKTAAKHLRDAVTVRVDMDAESPPEIEHVVYEIPTAAKLETLKVLLDRRADGPVLVFGRTKHGVKRLADQLLQMGFPVGALQGNLSQNARERVMADFRSGRTQILLATNVAARGLDIEGLDQIINFELPESPEWFTHRVGRTGRMGRKGQAITLITPEDAIKMHQIERTLGRKLPRQSPPEVSGPIAGVPRSAGAAARFGPSVRAPEAPRRPAAANGRRPVPVQAGPDGRRPQSAPPLAPRHPIPFSRAGGFGTNAGGQRPARATRP